jgi:putative transposase
MKKINYTYRFRLYPSADQQKHLGQHFGVCRFVYNFFLDRRNQLYRENKERSSYHKDCAELTSLKQELDWIGDANSQSLQQELKNLDTAFNRFFKKQARFPRFHSKKRDKQSFRVPQFVSVSADTIKFPKFREGIPVNLHREIEGEIKFATVSRNRVGQYYVSITVERHIEELPVIDKEVGIDLGVKTLAICSDGQVFKNIKPYRSLENRIKLVQKALSRSIKGSNTREKTKRKLAKLYQQTADIRNDHLHKVSHKIISENQAIYMEDLNVTGMLRNHKLAKAISDVSLYELVRQIGYKALWYGRTLTKISRFYPSSKACHKCSFINENLTLGDREWTCPRCRVHHDRDRNAAMNIMYEGKRTVGTTGIAGCPDVSPALSRQLVGSEAAGSFSPAVVHKDRQGFTEPIKEFADDADEILLVPPIQGGSD